MALPMGSVPENTIKSPDFINSYILITAQYNVHMLLTVRGNGVCALQPLTIMPGNKHDHDLHALIDGMQYQLYSLKGRPLFTTNCSSYNLFDTYLQGFPEEHRQYHNCRTCREFMNMYGGLVTVGDSGSLVPALWGIDRIVPGVYRTPVWNVIDMLTLPTTTITGVFRSRRKCWGHPLTKEWYHLHVEPDSTQVHNVSGITAKQTTDADLLRYRVVSDIVKYTLHVLDIAIAMEPKDLVMYQTPGLLWLRQLKADYIAAHSNHKANIIWKAVATSESEHLVGAVGHDPWEGASLNRLIFTLASIEAGTYYEPIPWYTASIYT